MPKIFGMKEVNTTQFDVSNEEFFATICNNLFKLEGFELQEICEKTVELFDGLASSPSVRKFVPEQFKNTKYQLMRKGRTKRKLNAPTKVLSESDMIKYIDSRRIQTHITWSRILDDIKILQKNGIISKKFSWNNKDAVRKWYTRRKFAGINFDAKPTTKSAI